MKEKINNRGAALHHLSRALIMLTICGLQECEDYEKCNDHFPLFEDVHINMD